MKLEIKKIGVWKFAIFSAIIGLVMGILLGVISYLYMGVAISQVAGNSAAYSQYGDINEITTQLQSTRGLILFLYPLFSIILCFIFGIIIALLYNLQAKWIGGIRLDVEERQSPAPIHKKEKK